MHAELAAEVIVGQRTRIVNEPAVELPEGHPHITGYLGVPLIAEGSVLGMVAVANKPGGYAAEDAIRLSILAGQMAAAIACGRLYERQLRLNRDLQRRYLESSDRAASGERQRLARDLHDSATQALYGIALAAQAVRRTADSGGGADQLIEPLDFILQLADVALAEMRALIFGLRPESLAEEGLTGGLQRLTAAIAARHELEVDLAAEREPKLDLPAKEAFHRISQEALHNVVKHAAARSVGVRLITDVENVELRIIDDGVGFDAEAGHPGHNGLDGMRERARALGLVLDVDSRPGTGTEIRLRTRALPRRRHRPLPWS